MRLFSCSLLCVLLLGAVRAPSSRADSPATSSVTLRKARVLVRQLGSRSFRLREQAATRLRKLGLPACPAVKEGAASKDPEIRRRCRHLLPELQRAELFARIAAFAADKQGKKDHRLPGWKLFRELAGTSIEARKLFAELSRTESELLELLEKEPQRARVICTTRCEQLWQTMNTSRPPALLYTELVPFFLVTAHQKAEVTGSMAYQLCSLLKQPDPRGLLIVKGTPSPFKRLVLSWIKRQTSDAAIEQALNVAVALELPEGKELAKKILSEKRGRGWGRASAAVMLGKAGGKEYMPLFESLLTDKSSVAGFSIGVANGPNISGQTELRDVALAMLVHLSGQKHAEYGFAYTRGSQSFKFNAPFLGFSNAGDREAAHKKWRMGKGKPKK